MGKVEDEQSLSTPPAAEIPQEGAGNGCRIRRFVRFRCVAALILGAAVLLSAIFWLPPFLGGDRGDPDSEAPVVASFKLQKLLPLLKTNIWKLEIDIYDEIGVLDSMVLVTSLVPLAGSNWTNVTFGVWPAKNSTLSSPSMSILRENFVSLVIRQSILHLTPSLFGDPSFFQVLKFPGGITVIPQQSGFPLQSVPVSFNFTLNFSIHQIQEVFGELKSQLESGLHLTSLENLYIKLTNLHGSTLAPPVIVQSSIIFAIGTPESSRMKQLAQTIKNSTARNLGLNHTVFGKVKQIQLSSILPRSLNSSNSSSTPWSPSPAPVPHANHRHHHRRHHHHRHRDAHITPMPAPTPAPSPQHSAQPPSRSGCRYRISRKHAHSGPIAAPVVSPHPPATPHLHGDPPAPHSSPLHRSTPPASSPLPSVFFAHAQPPSKSASHTAPPDKKLPVSLPPSSSFGGGLPTVDWFQWAFSLLLCLVFCV